MPQHFYGSINFDKLMENLKTGKLKTFVTENGIRLINVNIYIADQPDQYKKDGSISVPLKDEFKEEKFKSVFIGNLVRSTSKQNKVLKKVVRKRSFDFYPNLPKSFLIMLFRQFWIFPMIIPKKII